MPIHTLPDSYTKLLVHSDTTNGSTTLVDSSPSNHTIISYGDPAHSTTQAKFGKTSIYQDSSDDSFGVATHADFDLGAQDWTLDFWWYPDSLQAEYYFLHTLGTHSMLCLYYPSNGGFKILHSNPTSWQIGVIGGEGLISAGRWYHIAFVHASGANSVYVNGEVIAGPSTDTADVTGANASVNANSGYVKGNFEGYVEEYRISVGIARWTGAFTPPNKPYNILPDPTTPKASGGVLSTPPYRVHTFKSTGTFATEKDITCNILMVGGGGAGGNRHAGGGGGGGVLYKQGATIPSGSYTITIGAGGTGTLNDGTAGNNGADTTAFGATAKGGGAGGGYTSETAGVAGGSGGGGGGIDNTSAGASSGNSLGSAQMKRGTAYGNVGQAGHYVDNGTDPGMGHHGGGGGGAGGVPPANADAIGPYPVEDTYVSQRNGMGLQGGPGKRINIDGNNYYWAAGGGGTTYNDKTSGGNGGAGGAGGGGGSPQNGEWFPGFGDVGHGINDGANGGMNSNNGGNAGANTGSGGGGGAQQAANSKGGNGGSGIVIISYAI